MEIISFLNIVIQISGNILFFAAFLEKPVKVHAALKGILSEKVRKTTQPEFTCSKLIVKAIEQSAKYDQS